MMGLQNLCTLFGPTLMKLSPKDNLQADDMAKEIKESMQQSQVLFYILKLHEEDRLIQGEPEQYESGPMSKSSSSSSFLHNINQPVVTNSGGLPDKNNNISSSNKNNSDGLLKQLKNIHTAL
jgi:hypothetical protein